ncbi:MAG: hypothetical protein KatS3mg058_4026 [Roseiflexus sp.]|nr:MAG: hypothetical protein KatS3mg058_4026 [Roseiflexus sp.]
MILCAEVTQGAARADGNVDAEGANLRRCGMKARRARRVFSPTLRRRAPPQTRDEGATRPSCIQPDASAAGAFADAG